MSNNIRIIYLYAVAFITLGMIVGGVVSAVYNIANYFFPTSYIFFENESTLTNDIYDYSDTQVKDTSSQKLVKQSNYKKQKVKDFVVSIVFIVIGAIMYKYHWKIIENEKNK